MTDKPESPAMRIVRQTADRLGLTMDQYFAQMLTPGALADTQGDGITSDNRIMSRLREEASHPQIKGGADAAVSVLVIRMLLTSIDTLRIMLANEREKWVEQFVNEVVDDFNSGRSQALRSRELVADLVKRLKKIYVVPESDEADALIEAVSLLETMYDEDEPVEIQYLNEYEREYESCPGCGTPYRLRKQVCLNCEECDVCHLRLPCEEPNLQDPSQLP